MSTPLQLTYNGVALHDLGDVTIRSQSSTFTPDEFPQKETRRLQVTVETWAANAGYNYDTLYAGIQSVRQALQAQNKVLKWESPGDAAVGETQLERPVTVVSTDLPDDPNSWGVFSQLINITFEYALDTSAESTALTATVTGSTGTVATISLGQIHTWKPDYKNNFYSEWKNIRQRATGTVTCSGEIYRGLGETGSGTTDTRLADILADKTALETQLHAGKYIRLTYGPAESRFFDRDVKIDSFTCDLNQGPNVGSLKWNLTVSYTAFPDEDSHAGAEFTSSLSQDKQSGMDTLTLSGRIIAATEALAVSKLGVLTTAMLSAYGFTAGSQTRKDVTKNWVNADDTQDVNTTNDTVAVAKTAFMELSFSLAYEKKAANVLTYTLNISDSDDLKSGLITRTYSGNVMASSTSEDAAYQAALAKARELGDKKYSFRVSKQETRADRQMAHQGSAEFVRLDFQYVYQIKGTRMFLDLSTSVSENTFGESEERVSGYVVATDLATATAAYNEHVKALYTSRLVRNETLDQKTERVQLGAEWTTTGTTTEVMPIRLDFSLSAFKAKATNVYGLKYTVRVSPDYVNLSQSTSVTGAWAADAANIAKLEAAQSNPLTTFLDSFVASFGKMTRKEVTYDKELKSSSNNANATTVLVNFSAEYSKALSTDAAVLQCSLSEQITYTGTRNVFQQTATSYDVRQACGYTQGSRTVSGSVTAATEAAALAWVQKQHGATGIWTNRRGTAPASSYEEPIQIGVDFTFAPLTDGIARSTGVNFQVCTMNFTFKEICPNLPAPF